ncbi:MAG: hypothetical protein ABJN38_11825 [Lentilitoribacter sp.]|uniref:hypothetical protein n=1 Tax=Parasphingorhabdus sp. TaxID=2709688 RepID=UPI0032980AB9
MPARNQPEADAIIFVIVFFLGAIPLSFLKNGLLYQFLFLCFEIFIVTYISFYRRLATSGAQSLLKEHEAEEIGFQKYASSFSSSLGKLLHSIGRTIGDREFSRNGNFFTAKSFSFTLKLSAIYPFLLLVFGWSLGGSGILANFYVIPPIPKQAMLLLLALIFMPALIIGLMVRFLKSRKLWVFRVGLRYFLTGLVVVFIFGFSLLFGSYLHTEKNIDITLPLFVSAVIGAIFFGSVAGFRSNTNAFLPVAFLPLYFSISAMIAVPFIGRTAALVAAFIFSFTLFWDNRRLGPLYALIVVLIMIIPQLTIIALDQPNDRIFFFVERFDGHIAATPIVLFLGFLPVVNASIDWLSLNVTRTILLRISRGKQRLIDILVWLALDVIVAISLCLILLGSVVGFAAFIEIYNMPGVTNAQATRLDTSRLVQQISSVSFDIENLWLIGIALTGLLPSMLSIAVSVSATAFAFFRSQSRTIASLNDLSGNDQTGRKRIYKSVAMRLAATMTASVLLSGGFLIAIGLGVWFVFNKVL